MGYKTVEDMLKDPRAISAAHNCNFGALLKLEGLVVAKIMGEDFNATVKRALRLAIKECRRNHKGEYDALMKEYAGGLGKKKG